MDARTVWAVNDHNNDEDHRHAQHSILHIHYRRSTVLRVWTRGPSAPTALCVHGVLADHRLWDSVASRLAEAGIRSVVPSLPLGSHSTPVPDPSALTPDRIATAICQLAEHLALSDATLVGCDTGGALCQFVMARNPEWIGHVVLTNCDAFTDFPPRPFREVFALLRQPTALRIAMPLMALKVLRHSPLGYGLLTKHADPALTRDWVQPLIIDPLIRRDVVALLRNIHATDLNAITLSLRSFTKPVTFVWGADDRAFTSELGRRLAEHLPKSTFISVADARTFVPVDAPVALADAIGA